MSWYVEDRTTIGLAATEDQAWLRSENGTSFIRDLGATLDVTYRFSGWIATPGFFPAAAPLPTRR